MNNTRKYWIKKLTEMSRPVLEHIKNETLLSDVPLEINREGKHDFFVVEILGRVLQGLAPWIEKEALDPNEEKLRLEFAQLARDAIASATNPKSKDFGVFGFDYKTNGNQWVVDTAFLGIALLRAPTELIDKLDIEVKTNLIKCLKITRNTKPGFNNWLLFSAMVEAALFALGEKDYDIMRIDYALKQHDQWYIGDGKYKDGPHFADDYYNSYVIQPFIAQLSIMFSNIKSKCTLVSAEESEKYLKRFVRHARTQELTIGEDGSFPPIGRSITYRCGAFQSLAQCALWEMLPAEVSPAMARCALTKVIKKTLETPNTYREDGILNIGLYGYQPLLAESYISNASVYMATLAFLPLGLSEDNVFWSSPDEKTSAEKIWSGENVIADHKIN